MKNTEPPVWRRRQLRRRRGWGYSAGHPWTLNSALYYVIIFAALALIGLALG